MLSYLLSALESDGDRALFAEIYEQYHERMEWAALRMRCTAWVLPRPRLAHPRHCRLRTDGTDDELS